MQLFGALGGSSGRRFVCLAPDLQLSVLRPQSPGKGDLVAPASRQVALFSAAVVMLMTWRLPPERARFTQPGRHVCV